MKTLKDVPRLGFLNGMRQLLASGGGRVDMLSGLRDQYDSHGSVVLQLSGPFKLINLFGPDANRLVLMDRDQIFSAKRPWDQIMGRIFTNGLLLRDGADHKHHRKIMHEAFTRPALREYVERMHPIVARGLESLPSSGEPVLAFRAYKELTLALAASIFVGMDLGPATRPMNTAFENMVAASMSRIRLPWIGREFQRGLRGRQYMLDLLGGMLEKKHGDAGPDMFGRLCRARTPEGEALADAEVLDHMVFLMMAAHDTTTSTLTSLTYELAKHPEWQERLRDESHALGKDEPGLEELGQLESLGWALHETLRRYPPLPVIPRVNTQDFAFEDFQIPAGCMVVVSPIHTHHMSEWWSEPFRWDPARFAPGRAEQERHTHSWVPFGGGPHMCLGLRFAESQVRLVMHQLLLRYRWSVPEGYQMPVQQAPISKPRDGLPTTFHRLA
ncbi:MAG TPA: cytochrome P450 [Myxococcota bacterium]|nr:cytochrome P450 [Myxococcota bacterium]